MVMIQVKKPTQYEYEDIGDLEFNTRIPTPKGAKCAYCIQTIEEQSCIIGVKKDMKLMFFHIEGCMDQAHLFEKNGEKKKPRKKSRKKRTAKNTA